MAISQLEIVTGCLFIAVVEKENTNWILSDGGGVEREGGVVWISRFQIDDPRLTMGGDEARLAQPIWCILLHQVRDWRTYWRRV